MLILGAAAWLSRPKFVREGPAPCRNACINNLRQIDGAKEQWALDHHKKAGDDAVQAEVAKYIKWGWPKCPGAVRRGVAAGVYSIGKVDEPPRCSVPDHTL